MEIEVLTETSVKATVIPPKNSGADYYELNFDEPQIDGFCIVWFEASESCVYKDLKPRQEYRFSYALGTAPGNLGIYSETRIKSFTHAALVTTSNVGNKLL